MQKYCENETVFIDFYMKNIHNKIISFWRFYYGKY